MHPLLGNWALTINEVTLLHHSVLNDIRFLFIEFKDYVMDACT